LTRLGTSERVCYWHLTDVDAEAACPLSGVKRTSLVRSLMSANDPKRTSRVDRRFAWPPAACSLIAWKGDPAFFSWDTPCGNWTQPVKETALIMNCCYWTIVPRSVIRSHKRWVEDVVCSCRSFPSRRASNALRRQAARSGWASSLHEGLNTAAPRDRAPAEDAERVADQNARRVGTDKAMRGGEQGRGASCAS
jgi:hypothetical protein